MLGLFSLVETRLLLKNFKQDLFDHCILVFGEILNNAYLLPVLGISRDFGNFVAIGIALNVAIFQITPIAIELMNDFEGKQVFKYLAVSPSPVWAVFARTLVARTVRGMLLCAFTVPLGVLLIYHRIDFGLISIPKTLIAWVFTCALCSLFAIFASTIPASIKHADAVWNRMVFPLWITGATWFPFRALKVVFGKYAYFFLINPVIYMNEAIRAAGLGQEGYLDFWSCIGGIAVVFALMTLVTKKRLKKQLDLV